MCRVLSCGSLLPTSLSLHVLGMHASTVVDAAYQLIAARNGDDIGDWRVALHKLELVPVLAPQMPLVLTTFVK